jgi:hypothetical protein
LRQKAGRQCCVLKDDDEDTALTLEQTALRRKPRVPLRIPQLEKMEPVIDFFAIAARREEVRHGSTLWGPEGRRVFHGDGPTGIDSACCPCTQSDAVLTELPLKDFYPSPVGGKLRKSL